MRLINIKYDNRDSFKYSILLSLYYYNIKINYNRPTEIDKHRDPYILIHFNDANHIIQFERENTLKDLLIIGINDKPLFITRNNANIKITIVKFNEYRYSFSKPTLECFNNNINEINKINNISRKKYVLTDKIKEDLCLDLKYVI